MGKIEHLCHEGQDFLEEYCYHYDRAGNTVLTEKRRSEMEEDTGLFRYDYDAMNRLIRVEKDGELLREYCYNAFGDRTVKKEYRKGMESMVQYRYDEKGQLVTETDNGLEKTYYYDSRGNLTEMSVGEKLARQFTFDAANRMRSAVEIRDNLIRKVEYQYNGLGKRTGQDIWSLPHGSGNMAGVNMSLDAAVPELPEESIRYTLDFTRDYDDLLCVESGKRKQTFYWDADVAVVEEGGAESFYLQDNLGSPVRLADSHGRSRESYGYDEFGLSYWRKAGQEKMYSQTMACGENTERPLQPFGFTGYQMEETGGLYYAQARRYDAGLGRFISEDVIRGYVEAPYTLNHYGYCWNRPLDLVDLDGLWPKWLETAAKVVTVTVAVVAVAAVVTTATVATGGAALALAVGTSAAVGGVVSGFINEANGGSYINGWAGGAVSGGIQGAVGYNNPAGVIIGGAANGVGSYITDKLDNMDPTNNKHKTDEQILKDAQSTAVKGMIYSIPGGLMSWFTSYADKFPGVADALMTGYDRGFAEGLNQFYGILDNLLLGGQSLNDSATGQENKE